MERVEGVVKAYWDTVCVFLSDTLSLRLALLERVLVLELGSHIDGRGVRWLARIKEELGI